MKSSLLLYFDTNIIVPVSCDTSGCTHETAPICYVEKPELSHIETIRDFYQKTTGVVSIDTHFVFAESFETSLKKEILKFFREEGMIPKSFTAQPTVILTEHILQELSLGKDLFAENVIVVYSNDESLRVTGSVFDGKLWQWNPNPPALIPKVGSSPLKRSLVECLINERDRNLGAIDDRNREQEIEYQMQFADEWLAIYKKTRSDEDFIIDFKLSCEYTNVKLRINKREIEQSYEKTLSPAISKIAEYKEKYCSNSVKYSIFAGPAFEEENFVTKVKNALDSKEYFSVVTYPKLGKILSSFLTSCTLEDDFDKMDRIFSINADTYKSNLKWIENAKSLSELNEQLSAELSELQKRVSEDGKLLESVMSSVQKCMGRSDFSGAKDALATAVIPSVLTKNSIKESRHILSRKENMEGIFSVLSSVDGARALIRKIEDGINALKSEIKNSEQQSNELTKREERIAFCEEHYNEYLDLRKQFNRIPDFKGKREFVEKMKLVSDEPMPELNLRQVEAVITYTKETVKSGFLNLKKKVIVQIKVNVKDGETLPCDALLNLSNKVLIRASEGDAECIAYEIEKGESSFMATIDSDDNTLDFTKSINCSLFVGKNVLDTTAIKCAAVVIK